MSLYERYKVLPAVKTDMPDLPMKSTSGSTAKKRPSTTKKTTVKRSKTATVAKRPVKPLPTMKREEQPRDRLGRFARKTGAVLWGATKATAKGTVKAVKGTAKAIKKTHKAVKRFNSGVQRRARIEERERNIALAEREKKLGLRKKKVTRRKK